MSPFPLQLPSQFFMRRVNASSSVDDIKYDIYITDSVIQKDMTIRPSGYMRLLLYKDIIIQVII